MAIKRDLHCRDTRLATQARAKLPGMGAQVHVWRIASKVVKFLQQGDTLVANLFNFRLQIGSLLDNLYS